MIKYTITGLKTPTGRRQPVGHLQAWPRIRDDGEQIQQVARAGLETRTAGLRVRRAHHSATLPPITGVQKKNPGGPVRIEPFIMCKISYVPRNMHSC